MLNDRVSMTHFKVLLLEPRSPCPRPVIRADLIVPYESLWMRLVRFTFANQITLKEAIAYLKVPGRPSPRPYATGWDAAELRIRAHFSEERLLELACGNPENGRGLVSEFFPEPNETRYEVNRWSSIVFKYCPECLKAGVHMSYFQLSIVDSCPVHKRLLRTSCPRCNGARRYQLEHNIDEYINCACGRVFFSWEAVSTYGVDPRLRVAHRDFALRLKTTLESARCMVSPDYWGRVIRDADVFAKLYAKDFLAHLHLIEGNGTGLRQKDRKRLMNRQTETCILLPSDSKPTPSRAVRLEVLAIYKSICRHFYRRRFRAHRKSIGAIAEICTRTGDTDSGKVYWYKPRAPLAHAFILWRLLLENVESPDDLFTKREEKRHAPFISKDVDLPNDVWNTFWRYCDIQDETKSPEYRAIVHRYFATFALAIFDECLVRINVAFASRKQWRTELSTKAIGGFYIPLVLFAREGSQSLRMTWIWPWRRADGAMPHVRKQERTAFPKNEGKLITEDRFRAWHWLS
jgi:hypothetical protein